MHGFTFFNLSQYLIIYLLFIFCRFKIIRINFGVISGRAEKYFSTNFLLLNYLCLFNFLRKIFDLTKKGVAEKKNSLNFQTIVNLSKNLFIDDQKITTWTSTIFCSTKSTKHQQHQKAQIFLCKWIKRLITYPG